MIYLDNAATSYYKPKSVADAVYQALQGIGNSGRGAHEASLDAGRILLHTRIEIAELFQVGNPSRVVFTSNATESLNLAIQGLMHPGEHCITTEMEHNSVLRPLYLMEGQGVELTILPLSDKGCIDILKLEKAIKENTRAIAITHASNVTGNVNDIRSIGELCDKHQLLFILDASQSAGVLPIDMNKDRISVLCCSGHKGLMGPQGTGILALAETVKPITYKVGGTGVDSFSHGMPEELPEALEAGTQNTHGIAGLYAACKYIKEYGQEKIYEKARSLAYLFYSEIRQIPGIKVYGDMEANLRAPVIALNIRDVASGEITDELYRRFHIATRSGAHCAPLLHGAFGTKEQGMVRFSFSHFNTEEEIRAAVTALSILAEEYR
ncbi:MAG: Cysteine desulfurase family protein [Herbinix sp.]|nr:Cysteine desulfurase family protein [Herbinix sp.]